MGRWIPVDRELPYPLEEVAIRTRGSVRHGYYRIDGRWYALLDLERWQMNTSPHWPFDRAWYLRTDQVEGWMPEAGEDGVRSE